MLPRLRTQTRPSFSRTGSTVLDVCTGLVHGSVAPTFRCGAARRFKGSTARDAVSQVSSSTAERGTKKGPTIERRKGEEEGGEDAGVEDEEEIPGRVFSTSGVPRGRSLTPLMTTKERKRNQRETERERERESVLGKKSH